MKLPWGADTIDVDLPPEWSVAGVFEPNPLPPAADPDEAVRQALCSPIGSPELVELARRAGKVAIVVDDLSRPTPARLLMTHIVAELEAAGLPRSAITVVTALGTHRAMSQDDLARKIGREWADTLAWENHNYADAARHTVLGTTRRGTPVALNSTVCAADLVILVGVIEPHVSASFGGGYKNLIPGVADARTIGATHTLNLTPATFNMTGRPCEENPMRLDLEEAGAMLRAPVFIVNVVLDRWLRVVRVVAGHPVRAHREGVKTCAALCGVRIPRLADVVLTTSYPMDIDLRQGLKAVANNIRAVRPGGMLINLVRAEEGAGHMSGRKPPFGRATLKRLAPLLAPAVRYTRSPEGEEFKFFTYFGLRMVRRYDVALYAPSVPKRATESIAFAHIVASFDELWPIARKKFPRRAEVIVVPAGGVTYPLV
ncbi:MAG: nickel-dependent lactate racemase [Acidobacteria bacterium]|nr:nickel-dependent lactate racemase [Acidobacteriota bacterium]